MGRVKEHYLGNMSQSDIDTYLYNKDIRNAEYQEWLNSEDYVSFVNDELVDTKLIYSAADVTQAIKYGVLAVQVTTDEVGKDVYGKLLNEKVFEYLNQVS